MKAMWVTAIVLVTAAVTAEAGPAEQAQDALQKMIKEGAAAAPGYSANNRAVDKEGESRAFALLSDINTEVAATSLALAADGTAAVVAVDVNYRGDCGGPGCGKLIGRAHATIVMDHAAGGWTVAAIDLTETTKAQDQGMAAADGFVLGEVTAKVEGAEEAVKVFSATIGDSAKVAASMMDRKNVVLFGSEDGERYLGAQAKAKLAVWKLRFKVHDGIRAGVTSGKTVAWVAANVEATPAAKPKAKALPYRVLFVYEKKGDAWQLVQAQFSFSRD